MYKLLIFQLLQLFFYSILQNFLEESKKCWKVAVEVEKKTWQLFGKISILRNFNHIYIKKKWNYLCYSHDQIYRRSENICVVFVFILAGEVNIFVLFWCSYLQNEWIIRVNLMVIFAKEVNIFVLFSWSSGKAPLAPWILTSVPQSMQPLYHHSHSIYNAFYVSTL